MPRTLGHPAWPVPLLEACGAQTGGKEGRKHQSVLPDLPVRRPGLPSALLRGLTLFLPADRAGTSIAQRACRTSQRPRLGAPARQTAGAALPAGPLCFKAGGREGPRASSDVPRSVPRASGGTLDTSEVWRDSPGPRGAPVSLGKKPGASAPRSQGPDSLAQGGEAEAGPDAPSGPARPLMLRCLPGPVLRHAMPAGSPSKVPAAPWCVGQARRIWPPRRLEV